MIADDAARSLREAADIVNSAPELAGTERLGDVAALRGLMRRYRMSYAGPIEPQDIGALHVLRTRLAAIFGEPDEEARAGCVNHILELARFAPRLRSHDGLGWHVHYFDEAAGLPERIAADLAMALALLLVDGESDRLKRCAGVECARVFFDESKNRSRLYCDSGTCGNRLHVEHYRERQRARVVAGELSDPHDFRDDSANGGRRDGA